MMGFALAVVLIVLDKIQEKRDSSFRFPVLAVAVGIYLPLGLSVPIFIGGVLAWLVKRRSADLEPAQWTRREGLGLLVASGLITGEALMGVLVALLAGAAIVYSLWLILATLCFWFIRVENILMIFWNLYWAARWPIGIYPGWLRWTLTLIVPVAFAVTVPAQAISGRLESSTLLGAVSLSVAMLALSRWFWLRGLRRYSGASA